jgi:phospholipase A1
MDIKRIGLSLFTLLLLSKPAIALELAAENCMLDAFNRLSEKTTIGEIRKLCSTPEIQTFETHEQPVEIEKQGTGIVKERMQIDKSNVLKPFTLMSHHQNYFLLAVHNFNGWSTTEIEELTGNDEINLDNTEAQFQLSIKTPLAVNILGRSIDLYGAYTLRSFWQVYNSESSSPFRESNHEPGAWLQMPNDLEMFGFKNTANVLGIVHQSNGQTGSYSRSWNRVYAAFVFEKNNFAFVIKPWLRIPEDEEEDDNPDITDYFGHGNLRIAYKHDDHVFSLMSRNNLESGFKRGAIELGWSFPIFKYDFLKGHVQYFSGYGESLIDYNSYVGHISFGLLLTDFL